MQRFVHPFRSLPLAAALLACVAALPAAAATHIVNQVGFTFQPDTLTIDVGDTVEWHHSGGSHTVTNGTGPGDPNAGVQFDLPLTSAQPVASFTFNDPGDRFYFCRPHAGLGMTGRIRVVATTSAPGCVDCERSWAGIKTLYR